MQRLLAITLSAWAGLVLADYDAAPSRGADLTGTWRLNPALSDDAEQMLAEQLEEERQRDARWRRAEERARPPGTFDNGVRPPAGQRPWQKRRYENFRRMLGITKTLTIRQDGATIEIISAVEARRLEAGTESQVSMPEGQLADSEVGWDGDWFVIERSVRRGPRAIEKFRLLPKTDQLEYTMKWSGDTELSGMKIRRVFDRTTSGVSLRNPAFGPVR